MRITEISVTSLFGIFNHTIQLNISDRITIIHGPNGFGKTIILKMLYGLFNDTYDELREIPFDSFQVKLENGDVNLVAGVKIGFRRHALPRGARDQGAGRFGEQKRVEDEQGQEMKECIS